MGLTDLIFPVSKKDSLERLGLSVGPKTTRDRLLDLLGKHVTKKRPRLSSQPPLVRSRKKCTFDRTTTTKRPRPSPPDRSRKKSTFNNTATTVKPSNNQINYEQFDDSQLIYMLKDVGLDTDGFSRIELLKNCNSYHDMSKHHADTNLKSYRY